MPRHILALALGVCAGVAVMVVAARGIALSRMLYLLAGLIFAGNLFAALAFDYWSMLAARFIAGLPHGAYFGVSAIVATSLAAPGQASRDVCLMVTGMTIANLVGVLLGSFLAWSLSWRATFAVVACAALLLILALRLWMPHVPALPNKGFRAQFRFLGHLDALARARRHRPRQRRLLRLLQLRQSHHGDGRERAHLAHERRHRARGLRHGRGQPPLRQARRALFRPSARLVDPPRAQALTKRLS